MGLNFKIAKVQTKTSLFDLLFHSSRTAEITMTTITTTVTTDMMISVITTVTDIMLPNELSVSSGNIVVAVPEGEKKYSEN